MFWLIFIAVWGAGLLSVELFANRALDRAARASETSLDARIILFRVGQLLGPLATERSKLRIKGWITLGPNEIMITAYRQRETLGRYRCRDLASVEAVGASMSYGVLVLAFRDGVRFESIPVETGIRNLGLRSHRTAKLADEIRSWQHSTLHK